MPYFVIFISGQIAMVANAKSTLATNHQLRSLGRSKRDVSRIKMISSQTKKGIGNFCRLPSQEAVATPSHQAGRFRASCAKRIALIVKNVSPMSRKPRLASGENNGDDASTARLSGISHGRLGSTRKTNHPSATIVRQP